MNLQQTGRAYNIRKYDENTYSKFLLDNSTYDVNIPYSGSAGAFYETGNDTNFTLPDNGETGYYDITMTEANGGKWSVSILKTAPQMDDIPDQVYTGSAITPEPLVIAGSLSLTKGTDYEYSYTANTDIGTATVTVTFMGDYASLGSVEKTFAIIPAVFVSSSIEHGNVTADKSGAVEGETVTLTVTPGEGYNIGTVSYNDGSEHTLEAVNGVYSFTMPAVSVTISVTFTPIEYTITYDLDGGTNNSNNPAKYTVEEEVELENPTKDGYTFTGWTGEGVTTPKIGLKINFGSTGNRTYTANWEENSSHSPDPNAPKFKYQSLLLDGKIAVSFAMDLSGLDDETRSDSYMVFDISGDKTSNNPQPCLEQDSFTDDSGNKYYYFNCYIKSIEMANKIIAEFHYGDDKFVSKDYTARQYINDMLADEKYAGEDDYSVAVRNLIKAIKDYGHYAQLMLSKYHGWNLGGDYAPIENANTYAGTDTNLVNEVVSATEQYSIHKNIEGTDIQGVYFSLDLDSYTTINLLIEATSKVTASFKNGGGLLVKTYGNNQYLIEIADIPAHELNKTYDVVINAGESSCEVNISALSYVYSVLTKESEHEYEPELAIALYKYYEANSIYRPLAGYED